jgi:hypothetical protein
LILKTLETVGRMIDGTNGGYRGTRTEPQYVDQPDEEATVRGAGKRGWVTAPVDPASRRDLDGALAVGKLPGGLRTPVTS